MLDIATAMPFRPVEKMTKQSPEKHNKAPGSGNIGKLTEK
jgi:hypothetical protein